jgi:hypothetical protein
MHRNLEDHKLVDYMNKLRSIRRTRLIESKLKKDNKSWINSPPTWQVRFLQFRLIYC